MKSKLSQAKSILKKGKKKPDEGIIGLKLL
jgi:hypothetical protein